MLTTRAALVAEDLQRYGEPATAVWVLTCTEEELVRICTVADWLLHNGPRSASGASIMIAKACALAAVYVHEGVPRDLARARRGPSTGASADSSWRRPDPRLHETVVPDYGVGADARAFWGSATQASSGTPRRAIPPKRPGANQKTHRPRNPLGPAATLAKKFSSTMTDKLSSSGFVRRAHGVFSVALNEGASGWLALTTTTYRGSGKVYVTPNVAVVHRGVSRVMEKLSPNVRYRYDSPTIGVSLAALVPSSSTTDWIIEQDADLEPRTSALAATVRAYALPFMYQYEDLSEVIVGLRLAVAGPSESVAERLAVALLLDGDPSAALSELDAFASSIADRTDPAADDFRMFDQNFRQYVAAQSTKPA